MSRCELLNLGASWSVSTVPKDRHSFAGLACSMCAVHAALSAAGACERISAGNSMEQSSPALPRSGAFALILQRCAAGRNGDCSPGMWWWVKARARFEHFLQAPTILAWDLTSFCRNLPLEARSP